MSLRPGESVHFVSILNEDGEVVMTVPMDNPVIVPENETIVGAVVNVKVDVRLTLSATGKR